jgi:hypothetical protein
VFDETKKNIFCKVKRYWLSILFSALAPGLKNLALCSLTGQLRSITGQQRSALVTLRPVYTNNNFLPRRVARHAGRIGSNLVARHRATRISLFVETGLYLLKRLAVSDNESPLKAMMIYVTVLRTKY